MSSFTVKFFILLQLCLATHASSSSSASVNNWEASERLQGHPEVGEASSRRSANQDAAFWRNLPYGESSEHQRQHTGLIMDEISPIYDYFLEDGVFPPSVPEPKGMETSYDQRLSTEVTRKTIPYYQHEYFYATRISKSAMTDQVWQRLVAARNPKALEIRKMYRERALEPLRQLYAKLKENGTAARSKINQDNFELLYVRKFYELYHQKVPTRAVYLQLIEIKDPKALEAREMCNEVNKEEI